MLVVEGGGVDAELLNFLSSPIGGEKRLKRKKGKASLLSEPSSVPPNCSSTSTAPIPAT
jgi:hypothetical protein